MAVDHQHQTSSVYLTLKVFQLVNHFRRRLKPRVSQDCPAKCLGLDPKASRKLERGPSQGRRQAGKHVYASAKRVCKSRGSFRPWLKVQTPDRNGAANRNTCGDEVQQMLKSLDGNIDHADQALSAIASDDRLFFRHKDATLFEGCSLNELIRSLSLVHEGLSVLYAAKERYSDEWLAAQGREMGLDIDGAFVANYEHLLLRLYSQLIEALTRKAVEALLEGGQQNKTQRKLLGWFSEFANNQHPRCSTWPWSVSNGLLAVLWGVCWMYYSSGDQDEQAAADRNTERVRHDAFQWDLPRPHANEYINFGLELIGTQQPRREGRSASTGHGFRQNPAGSAAFRPDWAAAAAAPSRASRGFRGAPHSQHSQHPQHQPHPSHSHSATRRRNGPNADPRQGSARAYSASPTGLTYNASWAHDAAASPSFTNYAPDLSGIAPFVHDSDILAFPQQQLHVDGGHEPWQYSSFTQRPPVTTLPQAQGAGSHLTVPGISIRVTDASADAQPFTQPQHDYSFSNIYNPQVPQLNLQTHFSEFGPSMSTMHQETSPIHSAPAVIRHERTPSLNSSIPTPVSMSAPRSPLLSPSDNRRPSIASSHGMPQRHTSEESSSQDENDALSPRRNHAYKRSEEPPRNREGKMICKYTECGSVMFDRKCEWSKHMDKHDRPYKCNVTGCEKLQGFTYSGGLLRHEREVHKMHGGTKKSLFCPFPDCKRSSGSGFTRKENLAEHIRRVHRGTSTSADLGNLIITRSDTGLTQDEVAEVHVHPDSPFQSQRSPEDLKRKRTSDAGFSEEGDEGDLRAELKRLRRENEEKDFRLRQLEASVRALQQGR
ncbi:hypothetical protein EJ04DRAFT_513105 [Polyplosphaeria fusca]|uniref:C2H2-type domain-containing protein n=1 Tax=Polyplosphaeria fusca TaxID=682080 RepID=A0A9P4V0L1_9PLEO|nr:hypothetical protein EJ04DRAFT_513105 [Polyplosphaeria fusca]